jgi:signal transduction histidine kinase
MCRTVRKNSLANIMILTAAASAVIMFLFGVYGALREKRGLQEQRDRFAAESLSSRQEMLRFIVGNAADFIRFKRSQVEPRLEAAVRRRVDEACALAQSIYAASCGRVSPAETRKLVLEILGSQRFNQGRGGYFIYSMDGEPLLSMFQGTPGCPAGAGAPPDEREPVIRSLIRLAAEQGEGFHRQEWPPGSGRVRLSYVRHFPSFHWLIGASEYVDEMEATIQQETLRWIEQERFSGTGYLWIHTADYRMIVHPFFPASREPDWYRPGGLKDYTDPAGRRVFVEMVKMCLEKGSGFVDYAWDKPGTSKSALKHSFVRLIPEWSWIIGAGVYRDEVQEMIQARQPDLIRRFRWQLLYLLLVLLTLAAFTVVSTRYFSRKVQRAFSHFNRFFQTAALESRRIDVREIPFSEFRDLAGFANRMIEDRERFDAQLRKNEEQLRQAQKMEAIGRLAGGIAHDFNNLLTAIIGNSEMLLWSQELDESLRSDLEEIQKAAYRAGSLTQQLLAFSRKQILQPSIVNLNNLVANLEKMLRRIIGEDISLETRLAPQLGLIEADAGQIEQVIINLVINARDAMPEGGTITVSTRNENLDDSFCLEHVPVKPGPCLLLEVRDTGAGMDEEIRRHIFEPFFTTKGPGEGTGLGLSTVYGIISQSGGAITVRSEPGRGTDFTIYLPVVDRPPQGGRPPAAVPGERGRGETILLVEDESFVRKSIGSTLRRAGYRVLEAENGMGALRIAQEGGRIDLILTDMIMPDMHGDELAERLCNLHPQAPVVFMSGYNQKDGPQRYACLQKPFSPNVLCAEIRRVLSRGCLHAPGGGGRQ